MSPRSILASTSTFLLMGLFVGVLTDGYVQATARGTYSYVHLFTEVLDEVKRNYVEEKEPKELVYASIRGMLRELDPHSVFLDETSYDELKIETKGSFGGLGIVISLRDGILTVISPIEGTPAWNKGIQAGDRIVAIEGESTEGITTEEAVKKLRGPKGTQVHISVAREGMDSLIEYEITRDVISIKSIPYAGLVGDHVGYVRLVNFSEHAAPELTEAIESVKDQGAEALVLDLRNNSGGLLDQAVEVSDLFVEKGARVVYTKGRHESDNREWFAQHDPIIDVEHTPLVVLVNEGTASASEIVSGAIQDYDLGLIAGTTTYGKGSVQTVRNLSAGTALKLTTAYYYTPSGRSIHRPERRRRQVTHGEDSSEGEGKKDEGDEGPRFYTSGGREIRGGGGIVPDLVIENPEASRLLVDIYRKDLFFKFAVRITANPETCPTEEDFVVDETMRRAFVDLLREEGVEFTEDELEADRELIEASLRRQIAGKLWGTEAMYRAGFAADYQLQEVLDFLVDVRSREELLAKAARGKEEAETAMAPAAETSVH